MGNRTSKTREMRTIDKFKLVENSQAVDSTGITKESESIHKGAILNVTSVVGNTYCTGSEDNTIAYLEYATSSNYKGVEGIRYMNGHSKAVNIVKCYSTQLWSCSRDLSIKQWNVESGDMLSSIDGAHAMNIASIALNSDGSLLGSGSRDYEVKTWDTITSKCVQNFKVPRNIVTSLIFNQTGNMLYQGSEDLCIRGWDVRTPSRQPAVHITGFVYFPLCLDLSADGTSIACGCKGFDSVGCDVKIWDLRSLKETNVFRSHTQDVKSCLYIPNTSLLLSMSKDGTCGVWDTTMGGKIGWSVSQKVQYTSCTLGLIDDGLAHFAVSAFDGSLSFGTVDRSKAAAASRELSRTSPQSTPQDSDVITWEYATNAFQSV